MALVIATIELTGNPTLAHLQAVNRYMAGRGWEYDIVTGAESNMLPDGTYSQVFVVNLPLQILAETIERDIVTSIWPTVRVLLVEPDAYYVINNGG